jgi:hypothetical protein
MSLAKKLLFYNYAIMENAHDGCWQAGKIF